MMRLYFLTILENVSETLKKCLTKVYPFITIYAKENCVMLMRLKMAFIHYGIAVNDSIQDCKETAEVKEVIGKVDPHIFFDLRLALG